MKELSWLERQSGWMGTLSLAVGTALAVLTLVGRLDAALYSHLDRVFATREDARQMEERIMKRLDLLDEKIDKKGHR